jgi:hypothetical protein
MISNLKYRDAADLQHPLLTKTGMKFAKKISDNLSIQDVESLVSRIVVDGNGLPEIQLKYNLNDYL